MIDAGLSMPSWYLSESERPLLLALVAHQSWGPVEFWAKSSGLSQTEVQSVLRRGCEHGYLESRVGDEYRLSQKGLAQLAFKEDQLEPLSIHAKIYQSLLEFPQLEKREAWLAYHAALAKLAVPAYSWNVCGGERCRESRDFATALQYFDCALEFAQSDFKTAYVLGLKALTLLEQSRFDEALKVLYLAYQSAEQVPWEDFTLEYLLLLAQVSTQLGRYVEAERFFQILRGKLREKGFWREELQQSQALGRIWLEQGRYREALDIFEYGKEGFEKAQARFHELIAELHIIQALHLLGRTREASTRLRVLQARLQQGDVPHVLQPFFDLLRGKFEVTLGSLTRALRILEKAAQGFEATGDVQGKVEVLLTMSAPLLEHQWIEEAGRVLDLLSDWPDLKNMPTVEHSVALRRLALAAFAGDLHQKDLSLMEQSPREHGRMEDWLLFWFHLALAARRSGQEQFFKLFLNRARQVIATLRGYLLESDVECFLKRPDVARILRLASDGVAQVSQSLSGERNALEQAMAEPAIIAPPKKPSPAL